MSKGNRRRRTEKGLLPPPAKCAAHNRFGQPCKNAPIGGGSVCRSHGGSAPQVRRAAEERLLVNVDVLMQELLRIALCAESEAVRLAAVRDALDRAGVGRNREVDVVVKPWQDNIHDLLIIDLPDVTYQDGDDVVDGEVVEPDALPSSPPHGGPYPGPQPPQYGTGYTTDGFGS